MIARGKCRRNPPCAEHSLGDVHEPATTRTISYNQFIPLHLQELADRRGVGDRRRAVARGGPRVNATIVIVEKSFTMLISFLSLSAPWPAAGVTAILFALSQFANSAGIGAPPPSSPPSPRSSPRHAPPCQISSSSAPPSRQSRAEVRPGVL